MKILNIKNGKLYPAYIIRETKTMLIVKSKYPYDIRFNKQTKKGIGINDDLILIN